MPTDVAGEAFSNLDLDGLILSGGMTLSEYSDNKEQNQNTSHHETFLKKINEICLHKKIPILGVCRGLQLINTFYGGDLSKLTGMQEQDMH